MSDNGYNQVPKTFYITDIHYIIYIIRYIVVPNQMKKLKIQHCRYSSNIQ